MKYFLHTLLAFFLCCHVAVVWADAPADASSKAPIVYIFPFTTPYGAPVVQVKVHSAKTNEDVTASFVIDTWGGF